MFSAHLATYIKGTRPKIKSGTSFQEFEGSTLDAWDEDTDEPLKILTNTSPSSSPPGPSKSDFDISYRTEKENLHRPEMERVSSNEEFDRQPQAAGVNDCSSAEKSKSNIKNVMVNKLSEKLGKYFQNKMYFM